MSKKDIKLKSTYHCIYSNSVALSGSGGYAGSRI